MDYTPVAVAEAARRARVSEDTIRRLFDTGTLRGFRTSGGMRLIDPTSLDVVVLERAAKKTGA